MARSARPKLLEQPGEHESIIDANGEVAHAQGLKQVVDDERRFDVGGQGPRADGVEVALHELAVASALRVLAPPHAGDVIALERGAQLPDMLGREASQRHRQVESQSHPTLAVILEFVELFVGLVAPLAGEDLQILQRRRVDRAEAVGPINAARRVDQPFARDHRLGQIIAKALERSRLDTLRVAHWNRFSARAGKLVAPGPEAGGA